jgi:hypothetical protein
MTHHPKMRFTPLCDLHHYPMRRVMLEDSAAEEAPSFNHCERRDCNRIFRDGSGYSDFVDGQFDEMWRSARKCRICGGTLSLAAVDRALKARDMGMRSDRVRQCRRRFVPIISLI